MSRTYVTGAAASALNADGRFELTARRSWSRAELSEAEAATLADVYVRTFVPTLPGWYERAHGGAIDFESLRRCGRTFYGESPYEEPTAELPEGLINAIASRWFFSYCNADVPKVSVAVAASATHLRMVKGKIDPMSRKGGEFDAEGIPRGETAPLSPESAAEWLAKESGKRVASVPRLILPGIGYYAGTGRWLLELEGPVISRGEAGERRSDRAFFVGRSLKTFEREISRSEGRSRAADSIRGENNRLFVLGRKIGHQARWERVSVGGR